MGRHGGRPSLKMNKLPWPRLGRSPSCPPRIVPLPYESPSLEQQLGDPALPP